MLLCGHKSGYAAVTNSPPKPGLVCSQQLDRPATNRLVKAILIPSDGGCACSLPVYQLVLPLLHSHGAAETRGSLRKLSSLRSRPRARTPRLGDASILAPVSTRGPPWPKGRSGRGNRSSPGYFYSWLRREVEETLLHSAFLMGAEKSAGPSHGYNPNERGTAGG